MSLRARSFHIAIVLSLVAGLLATLLTAPGISRAQDEAEFDDYPPSVTVAGEQFILDRFVPLDRDQFERIADEANLAIYARGGEPPFETIYALLDGRSGDGLARYLPTNVENPEASCLAEGLEVGPLSGGEATYAFVGIETDIPTDALEEFAEADGQPVYVDPGTEQPAPELFLGSDNGLLRFLITNADGLPTALPETVPFGGQNFVFESDATETVDPGTLSKVGCVGPFPAFAATDAGTDPLAQLYLLAAGRYLSFTATGPAEDDVIGDGDDEQAPDDGEATPPVDEEPIEDVDPEVPADTGDDEATDDNQDATDESSDDGGAGDEATSDETPADTDENEAADDDDAADDETAGEEAPADTAEETPADTDATDDGEITGLTLEPSANLGNGGQPDDLPRELTVGDARYLFDRTVPLNPDELTQVAQGDDLTVYARDGESPFDAIYVAGGSGDELARYLPERLDTPETACPAEAVEIGQLDAGGAFYAFAGIETDLTGDLLEEIAESNGQPVYADPGADSPQPELFVTDQNGLLRFLRLGEDTRPPALAESLAFAGAEYDFAGDVTDSVNQADLAKVGCAGPFPTYTVPEQVDAGFTDLYVLIGGRLLQFSGEGAPVDEASPTEVPAELPTETAVPEDTEVPTEAPTETEVPTEVPTETPTETPAPTETDVPTETPVPADTEEATETVAPAADPTDTAAPEETATEAEAPTEAATEAPTDETAEATATLAPAEPEEIAQAVDLPTTIEVENTTYIFNRIEIEIDIQTLVQVDVIVVNNVELTVYAEQQIQGVAPVLYCVTADGEVVGQYVLQAGSQPEPPQELPDTVSIENTVYIFNEVEIDIDITVLVQVQVVVINNIELTVYQEPNRPGRPPRLYVVAPDGNVVGQYVESRLVVRYQDTTAAATAIPQDQCTGPVGPIDEGGVPGYLPNRIQTGGIAYTFVGTEPSGEAGRLTAIGCIGPFLVLITDAAPRAEVLYLRISIGSELVFRFEAATTFNVEIGPSGNPRTIRIEADEESQYQLRQAWVQYVYASQTVILFAADPEDDSPDVFFAVNVRFSVVGEVIGEYRVPGEGTEPSEAMVEAAEDAGLNADLTINGQVYLLVNIYRPVGTTDDGFVTLFATVSESEGVSGFLLGRDKRRTELFIYDRQEEIGG